MFKLKQIFKFTFYARPKKSTFHPAYVRKKKKILEKQKEKKFDYIGRVKV